MGYSKKVRENCYMAYRETGNFEQAARMCKLPPSTVYRWAEELNWKERRENDKAMLAERPYGQDKNVKNFSDRFPELTENDTEVLKQVKLVEAICIRSLRKKEEEYAEDSGLYPKSFDGAVKALKICWDTRDRIFNKVIEESNVKTSIQNQMNVQVTEKVDLIGQLRQLSEQVSKT